MGTKAERYDRNRYINPNQIAGPEWDKWRVEGGFIVGPFSGASIEAWAGAAKMSTWFAPTVYLSTSDYFDNNVADVYMGTGAEVEDFSDVHYGIAVNYDYRDIASLRVSWEGAPQEFNKGYAEALDRAKSLFAASVGVHPVKPLDITLSYSVRSGRSTYSITPVDNPLIFPYSYNRLSLGNAASLDLGATYRFTERFNVWAHVENLLNKKWQQVYGIPNKGITGLVGVAYRF
jgi:predicted porin